MKQLFFLLSLMLFFACSKEHQILMTNESKTIKLTFDLNKNNIPFYKITYNSSVIIDSSFMGVIMEGSKFYKNLRIKKITGPKLVKDSYTMHQGKQKKITYNAKQYVVHLQNDTGELIDFIFNLSYDGVAFRYFFPEKSNTIKKITEEKTTYKLAQYARAWLQPMSRAKTGWESTNPSYEEHYSMNIPINTKPDIGEGWVYPALFKVQDTWVLISETALNSNYCGSRLMYNDSLNALQLTFPQKEEVFPNGALNPESKLPWYSPWRIITMGSLKTITESTLGTDLAEKQIDMDTSYIKSGLSSWSWVLLKDDFTNFETSLKFIDYASKMNWPYCLIDADWDTRIGYDKMQELTAYAALKNVKINVWYNSSGSWNSTPYHPKHKLLTHEDRINEFKKIKKIGVSGVKIDFFGGDGQSMIAYYHDILKDAANFNLLVNFHGATLPRGWQRTYPHLMTMESIKGEEFITFTQETADLQPSHCAMLPFTRNVFDPMDFTPMVLDSIPNIKRKTTPAFELALPVLFLSGIQHIAEIPEGMNKQPSYIIDYLKNIPTDWDESKFIDGYPGKHIIMARKKENIWYIVGINGENKSKKLVVDLSFIKNKSGIIIITKNNHFYKNTIHATSKTIIEMKENDGFVMKF